MSGRTPWSSTVLERKRSATAFNCSLASPVWGPRPRSPFSPPPEGLATAIITGDEKALTVAQGIGKKIAQRILLELKDKLAKGQLPAGEERYGGTGVTVIPQNKSSEATAALAVLGYSPAEIAVALKGLDLEGLSLEEIVRQALRKMIK